MSLVKHSRPSTIWDEFFGNTNVLERNFSKASMPAVNIKETEGEYYIELAAPGLSRDDFNVELNENTLVISSEKKNSKEEEKENYSRKEFSFSKFQRSFTIPKNVNVEEIKGDYNNGILKVHIPKKAEDKLKKVITIG